MVRFLFGLMAIPFVIITGLLLAIIIGIIRRFEVVEARAQARAFFIARKYIYIM